MCNQTNNKLKISLTILIAVIVAILGFRYMKDLPFFQPSKVIYAHFKNVNGLTGGSTIYVRGVKVGTVKKIELKDSAQDGNVKVALNINNDAKINKGSVAYLQSSLLGNPAISIHRGNSSQMVPDGGTIKGTYSGGLLGSLQKSGANLSGEASQSFDKLNKTLSGLQQMVNQQNQQKVDRMLTNLQVSTTQLALLMKGRRQTMEEMLDHANRMLANFDTLSTQNKGLIDSSMIALRQTLQNFQQVSQKFNKSGAKLNGILTKINNGQGSVGKMVNDPELYDNLDSLSVSLNQFMENINKNPAQYLKGIKMKLSIF
jgi:ABC-type transporter Mla subunit MlaD